MNRILIGAAVAATALAGLGGELVDSLACAPQAQFFDGVSQWWLQRFDAKRFECATNAEVNVVFLGDSITHNWEFPGKEVWAKNFAKGKYAAVNCGISSERTENLIWRIEHGQFGTRVPKAFVLMIGTNNLGQKDPAIETPADTICGIRRIVQLLQMHYPETKIILHPIFPRGAKPDCEIRQRVEAVNRWIRYLADGEKVLWCDFNAKLMEPDGTLTKEHASDLLHPNACGYEVWAEALKPFLDYALGYSSVRPEGAKQVEPKKFAAYEPRMSGWIDIRIGPKRGEIERNPSLYYDVVMIGDSITHMWEEDSGEIVRKTLLKDYSILNLGFSGETTQGILWGVTDGGFLEGYLTRAIQILIGTNNFWGDDTPEDVAKGIEKIAKIAAWKHPEARILLVPLFPYGDKADNPHHQKCQEVNRIIRKLADGKRIFWCDVLGGLTTPDGLPRKDLFRGDLLHLTTEGYAVWAKAMRPHYDAAISAQAMKRTGEAPY